MEKILENNSKVDGYKLNTTVKYILSYPSTAQI